jgi:hypothetical protein
VYQCQNRKWLVFPYLTWLVAAATYLPVVSHDYNLIFLPVAALALWDRRDPVWVHFLMALLLLWWQPFHLPVSGKLLFLFKMGGLLAVAVSLVRRAQSGPEPCLRPAVVSLQQTECPLVEPLARSST